MNKSLKWILGIAGGLVIATTLFWGGINMGRALAARQGYSRESFGANGMMGRYQQPNTGTVPYGYGMMGGSGMMSGGMMGGYNAEGRADVEPLSIEEAQNAVEAYLNTLGNNDLAIREVMIFDNQAYVQIAEQSTDIGAMEVLVDPVTHAVYPEPGPNMMWNLKYSPMSGMMGGWRGSLEAAAEMPTTESEAAQAAQQYLDAYLPGTQIEDHADVFYGYYTLHVLRGDQIAGMLSVNGYSGQVFLHTWHGDFVQMSEADAN